MGINWRRLEKDVAKKLGLNATPLSGGGWIFKEDMESDKVLAQLKATEGKSISVKHQDLKDLIRHARVAHKVPVFVLYFIGDEPYLIVRAEDLQKAAKAIKYGESRIGTESDTGKRRETNSKNPLQIRGAVNKAVRRDNSTIPNRRGVSTAGATGGNRGRPVSGSGNPVQRAKATGRKGGIRRTAD